MFVFIHFWNQSFGARHFRITRNHSDLFRLVDNNMSCEDLNDLDCGGIMNGKRYSKTAICECSCTSKAPTLGFHNRRWTCLNNTEMRSLEGLYIN